jgi:hypothetical protein
MTASQPIRFALQTGSRETRPAAARAAAFTRG